MKKRNLFALGLAALAFTACSNDDIIENNDGNGGSTLEGEAWVALNIQTTASLRELNNPSTEAGSPAESEINTVRAIFFDTDMRVSDNLNLTVGAGGEANPGNAGEAFKVSSKAAYLLIVANQPTGYTDWPVGTHYSTVNAAVTENYTTVSTGGINGFMMTNASGGLEPRTGEGTANQLQSLTDGNYLKATALEAKTTPLTLHIDRVVSKVRVYAASNITTNGVIDATTLGWVLNVTNKKYFPVSERTLTWMETAGNTGSAGTSSRGDCVSYYDSYKIGSYRIDPNYDASNVGAWTTVNGITQLYKDNYNYLDEGSTPTSWNTMTMGTGSSSAPVEYCLENTQDEPYNYHAYTTQVMLKAFYAPNMLDSASQSVAPVSGASWIRINKAPYSQSTLKQWIEAELRRKYGLLDPTTYTPEITTTFNTYLAYLENLQTTGINEIILPDAANSTALTDLINDFINQIDLVFSYDVADAFPDVSPTVEFYAAGINYYKIMIKHDNLDASDVMNMLGEFGVVRNSVYDITLNSINNAGYPIIPGPDTDKKDEEDENWLSIQINVNDWTWYTQGVDL